MDTVFSNPNILVFSMSRILNILVFSRKTSGFVSPDIRQVFTQLCFQSGCQVYAEQIMGFLCLLPKIFPQLLSPCKCLRGDSRQAGFWPLLLARPGIFYLTGGLDRQALTHLTKAREGHTSLQPRQPWLFLLSTLHLILPS